MYYEAYNDASDLNEDGILDIRYTPSIEYYGYFDSYKCYAYSTADGRFNPTSKTTDKTCDGSKWSGDYLNYLTMSRMDTMRKVLYGGYRSIDSTSSTELQRSFVPQDAHSWGKEYQSIAVDGFDINKYTPFVAPTDGSGLRHLFATASFSDNGTPELKYVLKSPHRIWDWVTTERPVIEKFNPSTPASGHPGHPADHSQFEAMVTTYATTDNRFGGGDWSNWDVRNHLSQRYPSPNATTFGAIDGVGNPYQDGYGYTDTRDQSAAGQENYLAIFTGTLNVTTGGSYQIGLTGDDAVEVIIDGGTAGEIITGHYGAHGAASSAQGIVTAYLGAGTHTVEFRMEEAGGGDSYYLYWNGPDSGNNWQIIPNTKLTGLKLSTYSLSTPASTVQTMYVKVKVCDPSVGIETNCKLYPDGQYKPTGLLQRHGEAKSMYFGLMTGSAAKSTSGGVLRRPVSDISDEVLADTGQFNGAVNGIIQTLNKMRIYGFDYGNHEYNQNCGWIINGPMTEGKCRAWGNPIAEIMYEAQRYFAGENSPTAAYDYTVGSAYDDDSVLGIPKAAWNDPYDKDDGGFDSCSRPFMLVLSDINPSYDSDQLPGVNSGFAGSPAFTDTFGTFSAENLANQISDNEPGISGNKYIGQSQGSTVDNICSPKTVDGFGDIRGLCPEEPTKMGGYYSSAVSYYGHINDLRTDKDFEQNVTTYSVGLASPLPRIELFIGADKKPITLVPFGKTVGNAGNPTVFSFTPTNTIVDFYVETLTTTFGKFRINYEDVEQGADHDMDALVLYEYQLIDDAGNDVTDPVNATKVKISLKSEYAAGGYIQHMGYIISGTDADGTYLEVRDEDTSEAQDVIYVFDTPPDGSPAGTKLQLNATRIFTPSDDASGNVAELLKNPLWYAAKWGAFDDENNDGIPNGTDGEEWDKDKNGEPDTYFYVTNPLRLEEQLNRSFASILNQASSGTAASVISNTRSGEGSVYQSIFYPTKTDNSADANSVSWVGQVHSILVDSYGNMRDDTLPNKRLDTVGPDLNGDGRVYHEDINGNCSLDVFTDADGNEYTEDANGNGVLDVEYPGTCLSGDGFLSGLDAILIYEGGVAKRYYDVNGDGILQPREKIGNMALPVSDTNPIAYLWNSSDWLNSASLDPVNQRLTYISNSDSRYIFTWVDGNGDGITTDDEIKPFTWPATSPALTDLSDVNNIYPYLHLYSSFGDRPGAISALITPLIESPVDNPDFVDFLMKETEREMKYFRGLDYVNANGQPLPLNIGGTDIAGTELRSRRYDGKTWRLGDVTYSTPTVVGSPAESFHLLYKDHSYADFGAKYQNRRTVVYAGANDGMLHAFNGGFFDSYHKQFCRELTTDYNPYDMLTTNDVGCKSSTSMPELGAELWAYVPFNLLPHLHWLTETEYEHSYYVDLKPRIFDAKVFEDDSTDTVHPHGWGTIMVVGMRFGGATITADIDKTDGAYDSTKDPTMKSAYMIFDITDPESVPQLLGEITMPNMGFSTSYPTMVMMKDGDHDGTFEDYNDSNPHNGENRWFLAFGSGPADANGDPHPYVLDTADSSQKGKFYLLDLVKLVAKKELWTLTNETLADGSTVNGVLTQGLHYYTEIEDNSFVSDPITVDYDLDYNDDALYYGTVSTGTSKWEGKLRRIIVDDPADVDEDQDPRNWVPDSVLFNAEQPITAAANVGLDDDGRFWIFFGTGRYFILPDGQDVNQQSFYGIKEPVFLSDPNKGKNSWETVLKTELIDTTDYNVYTGSGDVVDTGVGSNITWQNLIDVQAPKGGWYINFIEDDDSLVGERNLGQAALIGGALTFTTFIPSEDPCLTGGTSWLWATYYKTGTAYHRPIIGEEGSLSLRKISLGTGLTSTPSVHVGGEDGTKAYIQNSDGSIQVIEEDNPYNVKSGVITWAEVE